MTVSNHRKRAWSIKEVDVVIVKAAGMNADILTGQYQAWLHASCERGVVAPCTDIKVTNLVRDCLLEEPELHGALNSNAFSLIASGLGEKENLHSALQHLSDAFQVLEQAALHLYFAPWRREFLTIKTYSGLYVHVLEVALPQDGICRALQKLGYKPQENGESFLMVDLPSAHVLARAALGFFAAQLECQILSEILTSSSCRALTGTDLIRERRSCRGLTACVERLQKLTVGISDSSFAKSTSIMEDNKRIVDSNGVSPVYYPLFCDQCHEPWSHHVRGRCRLEEDFHAHLRRPENLIEPKEVKTRTKRTHVDCLLHDCVFSDLSLEFRCAECHMLHSSKCSGCRDSGHTISQLCALEKQAALREAENNRYQKHFCLLPGHLPHYRCTSCKQLHYINCEGVKRCRAQGHNATMIMLEKDQQLWLQRSERDLTLLGLDIASQTENSV
ncbi:spermatogenesis-associated protein 2-like protein [Rhinophrynus dorsalis]